MNVFVFNSSYSNSIVINDSVSSSKSWVDEFINTFAPTKTNGEAEGNRILRAIGVKLE